MLAPYVAAFLVSWWAVRLRLYLSLYRLPSGLERVHWIGWENFLRPHRLQSSRTSLKEHGVFVLESTPVLIALPLLLAVI